MTYFPAPSTTTACFGRRDARTDGGDLVAVNQTEYLCRRVPLRTSITVASRIRTSQFAAKEHSEDNKKSLVPICVHLARATFAAKNQRDIRENIRTVPDCPSPRPLPRRGELDAAQF